MNTILIGYDLKKTGQDYTTLIEQIKKLGSWWHCLDSTWMVRCTYTAVQVRDHLKQYVDGNDKLLVVNITGDNWAAYGFKDECATWLQNI